MPFLQAILAVEDEDCLKAVAGYQGEALVAQITGASGGYLRELARRKPLALVLDDLHWADEASLNLLLNIVEFSRNQPILFICMLRPDKEAPSWEAVQKMGRKIPDRFHEIVLEPLPSEQTRLLLGNLLGMKELPEKIQDFIVQKAEGNPFFIEELIRSLIETKQIIRENGHWHVAMGLSGGTAIAVPDTLRGVLSARIDRLPEPARHVLQMAAVIGRVFDLRVLERLTNADDLFAQILQLKQAGLVESASRLPSNLSSPQPSTDEPQEQMFRHVLIQEAAYDSILLKRRPNLHRQVGESLEALHSDRLDEFAPLLAHHFYAAQDGRSLKYDLLAGEKAARLYANSEAAVHFERALEAAKRIAAPMDQIAQLYSKLGGVLELAGRYPQALTNYESMQQFARENHVPPMELNALMSKATIYATPTALRDAELSEKTSLQALELSRQIGDVTLEAKLNWNLMLNHLHSRHIEQAYEYGQRALAAARRAPDKEQLAFVLNDLGRVHVCRGDFELALAATHEARQLWRQLDNRIMLADNLGAEEEALYSLGSYDELIHLAQEALEICELIDNQWGRSYHRLLLGLAQFERGQSHEAIRMAAESVELGDQAGLIISSIAGRCDLAWIYGWCGATDKALELIDTAIKLTQAHLPDWMAMPVSIQVRLHSLRGDARAAEQAAARVPLEPVSIPYPHYTLMVRQAEIEMTFVRGDFAQALACTDKVLAEMDGLVFGEIPEILLRKAEALLGLGRYEEACETLIQASVLARKQKSNSVLWAILSSLAIAQTRLGRGNEAEENRMQAREIAEAIGECLRPLGLCKSFLVNRA